MHDPMVVAHEIPLPLPHRAKWRERTGRRWGLDVARRTNPENVGERTYPWWRPAGYTLRIAGRAYEMGRLATIWHVEPNDEDSGSVCKQWADGKPTRAWKWHVHHWHIQIPPLQKTRARLFDRCALCGRRGSPNHSHSWADRKIGWRKWRSRPGLYHRECSDLVHLRRQRTTDEELIRYLVAAYRVQADLAEADALARLTDPRTRDSEFAQCYRLTHLLGYERNDAYDLVKAQPRRTP